MIEMRRNPKKKRLRIAGMILFLLTLLIASFEFFAFDDIRSAITAGGSGVLTCILILKAAESPAEEGAETPGDQAPSSAEQSGA